jgi:hypothetical protein
MDRRIPVILPGGLLIEGKLESRAFLRPIVGWLEERMAELNDGVHNLPAAVTEILGEAIDSIGDCPVDSKMAASLCIADRQWLMLAIAHNVQEGGYWLLGKCNACSNPFDMYIDPAQLPVKPVGQGYPYAEVEEDGQQIRLRLPTGADQERIAEVSPEEAVLCLLESCIITVNGDQVPVGYGKSMGVLMMERIEEALEAVSPQVATSLTTVCPECQEEVIVNINPYRLYTDGYDDLYQEVHVLARNYHWSEENILSLTRNRRRKYLRLIECERNVIS